MQYARTSQGIFCMGCHETLLARKRLQALSKAKTSVPIGMSTSSPGSYDLSQSKKNASSFKDKSLPSLPPKEDPDGRVSPPPSALPSAMHSPIPPSSAAFVLGPSRPSKPPFDPSLSRRVMRSNATGLEKPEIPPRVDSAGFAPIVSVSQSTPVYSVNNNTSASGTLTESTHFNNLTIAQPMSRSLSSTDWDKRSSRLSTDSSRSSDYYDSLSQPPRQQVPRKPTHSAVEGISIPPKSTKENSRLSQNSIRGGVYLDLPEERHETLDPKHNNNNIPTTPVTTASTATTNTINTTTTTTSTTATTTTNNNNYSNTTNKEVSSPGIYTSRVPVHRSETDKDLEHPSPPQTPVQDFARVLNDAGLIDSKSPGDFAAALEFASMPRLELSSPDAQNGYYNDKSDNAKSQEDYHLTPPFSLDSYLFDDPDSGLSDTAKELLEAQKRIAELEQKLREKNEKPKPDVQKLETNINEKRKTIAGLEAKGEVAKKELRMLEEARTRKASLKDSSSDLVAEFTSEVSRIKVTLEKDIEDLMAKRNQLLDDIYELGLRRDDMITETSLLKMKHTQLSHLHNELKRQIGDKYDEYSKHSGDYENMAVLLGQSDSQQGDEPMVTVLDTTGDKKDPKSARRFWKRPIAKGVKGFNKVFTQDSHGAYADGEVSNVQHVTAINGSGGALFPTIREIHTKPHKSKNGWFKNNGENSTGGSTAPSQAKNDSLLMGYPIEKRIQLENNKIPLIVTRCIQEVEERGLQYEGIYRKSGARSQIQSIEEAFEKSFDTADFDEILSGDIAGVTSALKQYLRYLPNSLIHIDNYDSFVEASRHETPVAIEKLRAVVHSLPPAYYDCLKYVVNHLSNVHQSADVNLMTSRNLAVCFAPTLVRHTEGEREIRDMQPRNDGTQIMIEHYDSIFADMN